MSNRLQAQRLAAGPHKLGRMLRSFSLDRGAVNVEARTVELAFSSELPVERWFGNEILGHGPGEIMLGRLQNGACLLVDHNSSDVVGVVETVSIGADRIGRALVRFGSSARAEEIFKDVADGIRRSVSVGYLVHEFKAEALSGDGEVETYRATKWEPLEISIVAIPADTNVGIGRGFAEGEAETITLVESLQVFRTMNGNENGGAPAAAATAAAAAAPASTVQPVNVLSDADRNAAMLAERARAATITAIGQKFNLQAKAEQAVRDGISVELFAGMLAEGAADRLNGRSVLDDNTELDLSSRDLARYSMLRVARALAERNPALAAFENECSSAIAGKLKRTAQGFFVPSDVQRAPMARMGHNGGPAMYRDLTVGTASAGGNLVGTDFLGGSFIELLRNKMMVRAMGATILGGLVGNVAIPKQTGASTAYWVAENTAPTEGAPTVGQVTLSPKNIGAFVDISRNLMLQASPDAEMLFRNDLARQLAIGIDLAALHGTGSNDQPTGIAATSGIGSVAGGTNGLAPTWAHIVELEREVAVDNAEIGRLGYLTNPKVRGKLKTTEKASSTAQFVWGDNPAMPGYGMLNGYTAGVTNQVSSALTKGSSSVASAIFYGNWADLLIGEWGALDLIVDPSSLSTVGGTRIVGLQSVDIAVRNAVSFAAMLDALTT